MQLPEVAVLRVTARLFVMHIPLQQATQLIIIIITTSQIPLGNKEIGHIVTDQDIHLAIVLAILTNKTTQELVVLMVTAQPIVLDEMPAPEIQCIVISLGGLAVTL